MTEVGVMPKEQVTRYEWQKLYKSEGVGGVTGEVYGTIYPELYVRWGNVGKGSNVQLQLVHYPDTPWDDLKIDEYIPGFHTGPAKVWPAGKDTFSGVLSRNDVNNLIRVLRKARDNAYGSDE